MTVTTALAGSRIVVTRGGHQARALAVRLRTRGAIPLPYPCIAVVPPADTRPLDDALRRAARGEFDWLVVTSANAVRSLRGRLDALGLRLPRLRTAAVGPVTAGTARATLRVDVEQVSEAGLADALASELPLRGDERVLLPQGDLAGASLADTLERRGAAVTCVGAYRTVRGSGGVALPALLRAGGVDAVTLASASAAHHLAGRLRSEGGRVRDLEGVPVICIGPSTAASASRHRIPAVTVAAVHTLDGLLCAIEHALESTSNRRISP